VVPRVRACRLPCGPAERAAPSAAARTPLTQPRCCRHARSYEHFQALVERECKPQDRILVVGCGNSAMSEGMARASHVAPCACALADNTRAAARADMYRASRLTNIVSTDASPTVVTRMRERAAASGCAGITWQVADMLALPFEDGAFDVVIEKGSIDCFLARALAAFGACAYAFGSAHNTRLCACRWTTRTPGTRRPKCARAWAPCWRSATACSPPEACCSQSRLRRRCSASRCSWCGPQRLLQAPCVVDIHARGKQSAPAAPAQTGAEAFLPRFVAAHACCAH
jgi:hypothetical protein